jgi:outer membrane protein TolC
MGFVVSLLAGPAAKAEPAASVEALVQEALDRAPSLEALERRLAAAEERVRPAGALADPMVGLMVQQAGWPWAPMRQDTMWQAEVSQELPWPGKRGARRAEATAEAQVREAEIRLAAQRLIRAVRITWARLYAIDRERRTLAAAGEMLQLVAATAAARYASGQGEQEALVKAQVEASRLRERAADLDAERAALRIELNRLLFRPPEAGLADVDTLPDVALDDTGLLQAALDNCCTLAVARAEVDVARKKVEAARLEARPDFAVGLGAGSTLAPDPMLTLRVGMSLPFWREDKQDRLIAAAEHELAAAEAGLRAEESDTRAELARSQAEWARDQAQVTLYREAIVPQSALAMEAARASYLAGRGDFSMLLEDFRLWLEARVELDRREAGRYTTWAGVQELTAPAPIFGREGDLP